MNKTQFKHIIKECIKEVLSDKQIEQALGDIGELSRWESKQLMNRAMKSGKFRYYDPYSLQKYDDLNLGLAKQWMEEHPEQYSNL